MLITNHEISVLRDVPGSSVIRCSSCGELIVGECVDGCWDIDEEGDMQVVRFFAPCPECGVKNETLTTH